MLLTLHSTVLVETKALVKAEADRPSLCLRTAHHTTIPHCKYNLELNRVETRRLYRTMCSQVTHYNVTLENTGVEHVWTVVVYIGQSKTRITGFVKKK